MHPVFFVVLLRLLTTLMQLFISQMHATLKAALSIGWSVYQLVGWLVAIHNARVLWWFALFFCCNFYYRQIALITLEHSSGHFCPQIELKRGFCQIEECISDGPTDQKTDQRMDKSSYRDAWTHLKMATAPLARFNAITMRFLWPKFAKQSILFIDRPNPSPS